MYTILPSAFTETIPFWAVPNDDTERTSPSISVAIATGSIITDVSSSKLAAMFCAIGALLTGVTGPINLSTADAFKEMSENISFSSLLLFEANQLFTVIVLFVFLIEITKSEPFLRKLTSLDLSLKSNLRVSLPEQSLIMVFVLSALTIYVSLPFSPYNLSSPLPLTRMSFPFPPYKTSFPLPPSR